MSLRTLADVPAPAKLNLFLHVVGRRADGYHLLESLFVLIDWCDWLHFERRDDGQLRRHDLGNALPEDDLCLRAARALQHASGSTFGVDISIDKQLPSGAGMGGGSSDAASVLLALNRLWGLNWRRERLLALALRLGADVPFFVSGRNAIVRGIGEELHPLDWPAEWLAVVKPAEGLETRAIFGSPLLVHSAEAAILAGFLASTRLPAPTVISGATEDIATRVFGNRQIANWVWQEGRNDLQPPAELLCPAVTQVAEWLKNRFGNSRMTGSGSAVFARAGTGDRPEMALLAELPAPWVGRMCRSLDVHPLVTWAPD